MERLFESRKEGSSGFPSIEDSLHAAVREGEDYFKNSKERLIKAINNSTDNTKTKRIKRKKKLVNRNGKNKQLYLNDKLAKSHMRRLGNGHWSETLKEKLIFNS